MTRPRNRQFVLAARPVGLIKETDFSLRETEVLQPKEGEFLVRNVYLSLDPTMRGWMTEARSYLPPVGIGEVMRGGGIGEVMNCNHPAFAVGDVVEGLIGWQDYVLARGEGMQKVKKGVPLRTALGVLGMTGLSAYFGLLDIGKPREGETVVVSGAAGAVGSVAGQIAKIKGCRVIGIAGSAEKCAWLVDDLGFDACINYRTENVAARLGDLCPKGIDVFFDNVGGDILNAALARLRLRARIVLCGGISAYNATAPIPGPSNYLALIPCRAKMEGFIILDHVARFPDAKAEIAAWLEAGKMKSREDVVAGLENAPKAILKLFDGGNIGKLMIQIAEEPATAT